MKLGLRHVAAIVGSTLAIAALLLLPACLRPAQTADIVSIAGCILVEYAKVSPGRMPTVEEATRIALTCGARDEQQVLDLVSYHRVANRLEGNAK